MLPIFLYQGITTGNEAQKSRELSGRAALWVRIPPLVTYGELAERIMATVLKTGDRERSVGSNPTFAAMGGKQLLPNHPFSWWTHHP